MASSFAALFMLSKLNDFYNAKKHKDIAASFVPNDPHVRHNQEFLSSVSQ